MYHTKAVKVIFNASKSKCIHFSPKGHNRKVLGGIPIFSVCSQPIEMLKQWSHLDHIISHDMDDRYDITRCHDSLVRQINNVLCFFGKLDSVTKFRLLISYCFFRTDFTDLNLYCIKGALALVVLVSFSGYVC